MTVEEIQRRLQRYHPSTIEDILVECGFGIKFIANGMFRATFKIARHPLVIKVPFQADSEFCIKHANDDFDMYQKIMRSKKKYLFLKPYMPKVLFHSHTSGVTVVEQCRPLEWTPWRFRQQIIDIDKFCVSHGIGTEIRYIHEPERVEIDSDLGVDKFDNYGVAKDGSLKILDLGCSEGGCAE